MKMMTIINNSHRNCVLKQIEGLVKYFESRGASLTSEIKKGENEEIIDIYLKDKEDKERIKRLLDYYIANVLYEVVIEEFIARKLSKYLNETYTFLNYKDLEIVRDDADKILREEASLNETVIYCMNRKNRMIQKIIECIEEGASINVKGFLDFRFNELKNDIYACIEKIVEGYMLEKEYNEFISLLKYFVEVQDSKAERMDIFIGEKEGEYILRDQFGNDMMESLISELCENKNIIDISMDDLVISGLITTCPNKIIIHSASKCKNKELLNTIKSVFEGRVEFCEGCNQCSDLKEFIKVPVDTNIKI